MTMRDSAAKAPKPLASTRLSKMSTATIREAHELSERQQPRAFCGASGACLG